MQADTSNGYFDEKTGLLTENDFFALASSLLERIGADGWHIIAIDLDHFRLFNDWYGRETGDALLSLVGGELKTAADRLGGLAGYLGQDNFCFFAPCTRDDIDELFKRLSGHIARLATSIGFNPLFGVSVTDGKTPFMDLFDCAKTALENTGGDFKQNICYYKPAMKEEGEKEYRVLLDFQRGIREHEFVVYLQPQVRISSGKIIGAEALVRWCKPDGSMVSPAEFIPVLEKHGFITDLDCHVWELVCKEIRAWIDSGHEAVPVSVNVSQVDIFTLDIVEFFDNLLKKYNLPCDLLKIEITESTYTSNTLKVAEVTSRLRDLGFKVFMDDFGSGYSSLNMLSSLNVDVIKLDADFLRMDEESKRKNVRIVESIINMAKAMALPVITEGVETKEQVDFLESLGCRYIQGFYYYKPMSMESFEQLVYEKGNIDDDGIAMKANLQLQTRELSDTGIYSDSMLNNLLGPIAYYSVRGKNVDIIRFNEQFYEAVGVPGFQERLKDIQNYVPSKDHERFYALFNNAVIDDLNGSQDVIGFFRPDGSLSKFHLRVYYLGENGDSKRFIASAYEMTALLDLQAKMEALSQCLAATIVFMRQMDDRVFHDVLVHGLVKEFGLDRYDLQSELDRRVFFNRFSESEYGRLKKLLFEASAQMSDFTDVFTFESNNGPLKLRLEADYVKDNIGMASFIVKFECE